MHHCYYNATRRALLRRARQPNDLNAEQIKGRNFMHFNSGSLREIYVCPTCWARFARILSYCTFHVSVHPIKGGLDVLPGRGVLHFRKKGGGRLPAESDCLYRTGNNYQNYYIFNRISYLHCAYLRSAFATSSTDTAPDYIFKWQHFHRPPNIYLGVLQILSTF